MRELKTGISRLHVLSRNKVVIAVAFLVCLMSAESCNAQLATTGTIAGSVTDASGAALPGTDISVTNAGTGVVTKTVTNASGSFSTTGLSIGRYDVTATAPGFGVYKQTGIYLGPAAVYNIAFKLKPATLAATVTVDASAAQVQTSTPEIVNQVTSQQVEDLPLNGRSYEGLASLMPGVTNMNAGTALGTGGFVTQNSMNINGTGQTGTLYTVDGIWNMQTSNMQETTIKPNPDQIEEVKVLQNNYSVVYNIMGANAVIVQTKSGTDVFHGGAWEFIRNDLFDSRNYFSTSVLKQRQNIFGWNLGGPIYIPGHYNTSKGKTFFYVNQQWVRQQQPMLYNGASPTAAMRGIGTPNNAALFPSTGLYSTALLTDPTKNLGKCSATNQGACFAKDTSGNWVIPASKINQNSLALLNALASLPNNQTSVFNNYLNPNPAINNQFDQEYKVEHNISSKLRLLGEFFHEGQAYTYPRGQRLGTGFPTNYDVFTTHNSLAQVQLTQMLSSSMTNQTSMAMNRYIYYHDINGISQVSQVPGYSQNLPFTGGYLQNYLPTISFSGGWSSMGTGSSIILPRFTELEKILTDNWSWLHHNHFIQAGGTLLWGGHREYSNSGSSTTGTFSFNGNTTGNSIVDYLLGYAATFGQSSTQVRKHIQYPIYTFYGQDQWQVRRGFSITAGLRWLYMPMPNEQAGYEVVFDPTKFDPTKAPTVAADGTLTTTPAYDSANGLISNGVNGVPSNLTNAHNYYFAPVVGFAWDLFGDGRTSLRGGYSINYTKSAANSDCAVSCISAPAIKSISLINVNFPNPTGGKPAVPTAFVAYGEDFPNMQAAKVQTYSVSLQHQFAVNWFVSAAGAGSVARHLPQMLNLNQPRAATVNGVSYDFNPLLNSGSYSNSYFAPYQGYSTINYYTSGAYANWNAMELNLRHPLGHNLFWSVAYTWSHGLSTLSGQQFGIEGSNPQNSNNPAGDYGNTSVNVPQVFATSIIYKLPWFQTGSLWQRTVLGGWKFADLTSVQGGASLSPGLSTSNTGLATRPNLVAPITYPKSIAQWFSTTSFAKAANGYYGNASRGSIVGPDLVIFDMAVYKDFAVGERVKIQWRTEFFNVFNHTNFNAPNTNFGAGAFGTITSSKDPRMGEMALKVTF